MIDLFHFTDRKGARAIGRYGVVIPRVLPAIGAKLAWFTDDVTLDREALGLTMMFIINDRMKFLYRVVDDETIEPFLVWAKRVGNPLVSRLIDDRKCPEHWFVSSFAVPVRQVRDYVQGDAGASIASDRR